MGTSSIPELPTIELVYEDGEPMDSPWHRDQMNLLIQLTRTLWHGRTDFYTGGNMFVYFSLDQARNRDYRGPDYFAVTGVDGGKSRNAWVVWEEDGRYPDIIVELLSPATRNEDLGKKKSLYEKTFRTPEYFCVDPEDWTVYGWRLSAGRYEPLSPGEDGRLESQVLDATVGLWTGMHEGVQGTWVRLWNRAGQLIPASRERVEAERSLAAAERARADAERERADAASRRASALEEELRRYREKDGR